jgi:hypothetical protein
MLPLAALGVYRERDDLRAQQKIWQPLGFPGYGLRDFGRGRPPTPGLGAAIARQYTFTRGTRDRD